MRALIPVVRRCSITSLFYLAVFVLALYACNGDVDSIPIGSGGELPPPEGPGGGPSPPTDELAILRASDAQVSDMFGSAVAANGNTAIVGASQEDGGAGDPRTDSGAAYVFERDGLGAWNEITILRASDSQAGDFFGRAVSVSGSVAILASHAEDGGAGDPRSNSGAAYVFERDGLAIWNESAILRASDSQTGDLFGTSVSVSGDTIVVGAQSEDGGAGDPFSASGAAYVFERDVAGAWNEVAILRASDAQASDQFGYSAAVSGGTAVIAAWREGGGGGDPRPFSGAAYVFERDGLGAWNEVAILRASDSQASDFFGASVSVSGGTGIIGAPNEDGGVGDPRTDSGAAYVFERDGLGAWNEVAILRASDSQASDGFGISVSISGSIAIVGAYIEDGGAGNPRINAGAAYVFERDVAGAWNEVAILRASDSQASDGFGGAVSVSEGTAMLGASGEDGGGGDPLADSGAAYIFE